MNDSFREFGDNSGKLQVTVELGPGGTGPRPPLAPAFVGSWVTTGKKGANRELRRDGTAWTGVTRGSWVQKNAQEAVLRWQNGAIERMTVNGGRAVLKGHTGRTPFQLKKE
jgi:hypothetical protein